MRSLLKVFLVLFAIALVGGGAWVLSMPLRQSPIAEFPFTERTPVGAAPHSITVFVDYHCPACRVFHEAQLPEIVQRYVASGRATLHFEQYAVHRESARIESMIRVLEAQGASREVLASIAFERATFPVRAEDLISKFVAAVPGANGQQLRQALADRSAIDAIASRMSLAMRHGVDGVPTLVIDRRLVIEDTDADAVERAFLSIEKGAGTL